MRRFRTSKRSVVSSSLASVKVPLEDGALAAIAVLLARKGAKIFGGNRTLASAIATKEATEAEGGPNMDASIDILVNYVGRSEPGCPATWNSQMDSSLKPVFLACHNVLPVMEEQGGVGCSAAKAAIMQFMKATAVIYAPKGVRLNTVVPGLDTPYTKNLVTRFASDGGYEAYMKMRNAQVPTGRMGVAWDVADTTLFLVSEEAKYITGQKIVVDGGIASSTGRA
ncbi:putative oxidoreductase [Lachnellula willkommii]|uniref:Putative oxidoreductase n=1 Tax=Lachnellula willkommii TaxID=215461 RepID=A0A559M9N4_9HELO|nr:putative oxidoreductase [Lachnellula willkommii]